MENYELNVFIKITDKKGLILGRSVTLFGKPRKVVGLWNSSIVFANEKPSTISDCEVLIYTVSELREFFIDGDLKGLTNL